MVSEKTDVLYLTRDDMYYVNEKLLSFENITKNSFTSMITALIRTHGIVYFTDTDGKRKTLKERK